MKTILLKYLDELYGEYNSFKFKDETFSQFVERTTDNGEPVWQYANQNRLLCPNCRKELDLKTTNKQTYDGQIWDVYTCEDCANIVVLDWKAVNTEDLKLNYPDEEVEE